MKKNMLIFCRLCAAEINGMGHSLLDEIKFKILFPKIALLKEVKAFSCHPCLKTFNSFYEFHAAVVNADENLRRKKLVIELPEMQPLQCPHCIKILSSKSLLRIHVNSDHKNEVKKTRYGCHICNCRFAARQERDDHEKIHADEKPFLCEYCGNMFQHSNNLHTHLKIHSSARKKYVCQTCKKSFVTRTFLREHENAHNGLKPFKCPDCGKQFQGRGHLRQHRWSHAGQRFHCDQCGTSFSRKSNMVTHIRLFHLKVSEKNVEPSRSPVQDCTAEGVSVVNSEVLKFRSAENKSYKCKRCKSHFEDEESMKVHYRATHTDSTACKICGKTFKHHGSLTYHRRVAHTGSRPFQCSSCDQSFALKALLRKHEAREHTSEKKLACSIVGCKKEFKTENMLANHVKSHEKSFVCEMCGKRVRSANGLKAHLKFHERKIQCPSCGETFDCKEQLARHEKMHTMRGVFFCKFCGDHFNDRKDVTKHQQCNQERQQEANIADLFRNAEPLDEGETSLLFNWVTQTEL